MNPEIFDGLTAAKVLGAIFGTILALIFIPPRTVAGFLRRLAASLIFGFSLAPYTRAWAAFDLDWEGTLGAACLTAFVAWGLMGVLTNISRGRAIQRWIERKLGIASKEDEGEAE